MIRFKHAFQKFFNYNELNEMTQKHQDFAITGVIYLSHRQERQYSTFLLDAKATSLIVFPACTKMHFNKYDALKRKYYSNMKDTTVRYHCRPMRLVLRMVITIVNLYTKALPSITTSFIVILAYFGYMASISDIAS